MSRLLLISDNTMLFLINIVFQPEENIITQQMYEYTHATAWINKSDAYELEHCMGD